MKILLVSMPSLHVMRWVENIDQNKHELFWFDILNRGVLHTELIPKSNQYVNWKKRKLKYVKGEFLLSKKNPSLYNVIQPILEITVYEKLEEIIKEINPDVVHSFEMQNCSYPLLKTMKKHPTLKWMYSCWGSDLYFYGEYKAHKKKIKKVLNRVNYFISDCKRDSFLAKKHGFGGEYLDTIYGGGGFKINEILASRKPLKSRKIILVKGYEHQFGRALNVIKALEIIKDKIAGYQVIVFATHEIVQKYIENNNLSFKVYGRHNLSHNELLTLMGKSLISIGNSVSDGMPNTLLETIVMGAFPIQTNPGGATEDIITHDINGLLIEDAENINTIKELILKALFSSNLLENAYKVNTEDKSKLLDYQYINKKIASAYAIVEKSLLNE
ncbi:hypothetical protein BFR04_07225 [Gaetbulibacter sp. 4G1]|nr:glycosyltransferase [Gaetbulibacter sp. 4G1]PIA78016.1 hypothetical protein BFR04_07225 [Gaetbulibacter sp. 4G1]